MLSYKFLSKNGVTVGFAVAVLAILVTIVPILLGLSALEPIPQKEQAFAPEGNIFYPGIYVSAILLIAAVVLSLGLSLLNIAKHPKEAKKSLISFAVLVAIFGVLYAMASNEIPENLLVFNVSETIYKVVGAGIALTLILGLGAVIAIVVMEVINFFKNQ
jgi:hypothetical protein